jgi:hypothetical protein
MHSIDVLKRIRIILTLILILPALRLIDVLAFVSVAVTSTPIYKPRSTIIPQLIKHK